MLLVDDSPDWTRIQSLNLGNAGYEVEVANTPLEAYETVARTLFDLVVIDINLGTRETGDQVAAVLRQSGFLQPIILVTGDEDQMARPISDFSSVLALGPTHFWDKNDDEITLANIVHQASRGVDPIRRSLLLMREAGLGDKRFRIDNEAYTVNELLDVSLPLEDILSGLREALMALVLESAFARKEDE